MLKLVVGPAARGRGVWRMDWMTGVLACGMDEAVVVALFWGCDPDGGPEGAGFGKEVASVAFCFPEAPLPATVWRIVSVGAVTLRLTPGATTGEGVFGGSLGGAFGL